MSKLFIRNNSKYKTAILQRKSYNSFNPINLSIKSSNGFNLVKPKLSLTSDILENINSAQEFSDEVTRQLGVLSVNNIPKANFIKSGNSIAIRYSDRYKNPNDYNLFSLENYPCPKNIKINYSVALSKMANLIIELFDENNSQYQLLYFEDAHNTGNNNSRDGEWVCSVKKYTTPSNSGSAVRNVEITNEQISNFVPDINKNYRLSITNVLTLNGYATNPLYISNLEIEF